MSRVQKIISKTEKININKEEIAGEVKRFFHERSYLYVVMDYGVGMGLYENGDFQIRMESEKKFVPIPWEYVQELAVFNQCQELRLRHVQNRFCGRYCVDEDDAGLEIYFMDEVQKLWGNVELEEDGYYLLTSLRGSRLWVPVISDGQGWIHKQMGIRVRSYMDFPQASERKGLFWKKDERFLGICSWP
ncbi:CRISPR-associated protein Csx19 [Enterocloster aldenensis]|uniref:type III-D CRISPR-associated protein Csx19 n=1 Tax=Enterocloster aldenensis TaxID=358742 RepID=UPI0014098F21